MKKLLVVFLALAALAFAACNKDVDDEYGAGAGAYKLEEPTACPIPQAVAPNTPIRLYNAMDADADIYYTTDGTEPTTSSSLYDNNHKPEITNDVTIIKAYCVKPGMKDSDVATFNYTVNINMAATPVANPDSGGVPYGTQVTLSTATPGADIYYTINGGAPTTSSTRYVDGNEGTYPIIEGNTGSEITIKAIAVKDGMENSAMAKFDYTVTGAAPPVYSPVGFYKDVNTDGSGGEPVDISKEEGNTWIDKAIKWLSEHAGTTIVPRYTLSLGEDIPAQSCKDIDNAAFNNNEGVTFFITTSGEGEVKVDAGESSSIFHLSGNKAKTLVLNGAVNLVGRNDNSSPLIIAEDKAVFKLNGSAKISGNTGNSETGGGVAVINGGTFIMNGGEIYGNEAKNKGAGVYVASGGEFTMAGGKIHGNEATVGGSEGGGVCVEDGTFTMYGGEIYENTVSGAGDECLNNGGGVYIGGDSGSTFTMTGGKIYSNLIELLNTHDGGLGGGVCVDKGAFTMNDGEIYGNGDSDNGEHEIGGGVYVGAHGTFTMNDGEIYGNTICIYGGGVCVDAGGTFTMKGGLIYGNSARSMGGGGVAVTQPTGQTRFTMEGGVIYGNSAGRSGGGVLVNGGTFTMQGGMIVGAQGEGQYTANTSDMNGAALVAGGDGGAARFGSGGGLVGDTPKGAESQIAVSSGGGGKEDNGAFTDATIKAPAPVE